MASVWDKYGEPENSGASFLSIEPGESQVVEFTGEVKDKTFLAKGEDGKSAFPNQTEDITVPSVTVIDQDGIEVEFDLLNTTARNAFLKLKPEPGTQLFIANHGKPRGKGYVLWTVRKARETDAPGVKTEKTKVQVAPTPVAKSVNSEPDF
jgi:hypothetical protein